mmetsp:Transcript_85614/g.174754  ORF Transcript_85614/g.174754 Transcript_85614/m.174754 type:complete len:230 (-) Transcript_85614:91-780(-)
MFHVQVRRLLDGDEELAAVSSRASIRHGQEPRLGMFHLEIFIRKLLSINGFSTSSIASCEVATLTHELRDNPVEAATLIVQGLSGLALALLSSAEGSEILSCLWHLLSIKAHKNSTKLLTIQGDLHKDLVGDAGVWWHILTLHQVFPSIPLGLLQQGNHDASRSFAILLQLPIGFIWIHLLPKRIINNRLLPFQTHLQRLFGNLHITVFGLNTVLNRHEDLDFLALILS